MEERTFHKCKVIINGDGIKKAEKLKPKHT